MKTTELMIGNYVKKENSDAAWLVTALSQEIVYLTAVNSHEEDATVDYEIVTGIDITSDLLESLGIDIDKTESELGNYIENYGLEIKYLHQLQNIYLICTGKQLELTA